MATERTRRQVFSRGIALGALGLAFDSSVTTAGAAAPAQPDLAEVSALVEIELLGAFVYQITAQSGLLSARASAVVQELLAHERAHAGLTVRELRRLGGAPPAGPLTVAAADQELAARDISRRLAGLRHERDCVSLLLDIEALAAGAYYAAISKLSDPRLLRIAAEIMANEAQHETVLNRLLAPRDFVRAAPSAFVR